MNFIILLSLGLCLVALKGTEAKVDIDVRLKECSTNAQHSFDFCLSQLLEDIRPLLKEGIPELNVPVLEPIFWKNLEFRQKNGSIDLTAKFNDVFVHGFSNFTLQHLRSDLQKSELQVKIFIPALDAFGNYVFSGKLIFFPINGNGPFTSNIRDIDAGMVSQIVVKNEAGKERLGVENTRINFRLSRARSHLKNLFDGDKFLGDTVNHFLNTNDQLIINEIKPFLSKALSELVEKVMDNAMATIPINAIPVARK